MLLSLRRRFASLMAEKLLRDGQNSCPIFENIFNNIVRERRWNEFSIERIFPENLRSIYANRVLTWILYNTW